MPEVIEIVTVSGLGKVTNPEILRQFVQADKARREGRIGTAASQLAQAIRNAVREINS
jgi:hypothetical protein